MHQVTGAGSAVLADVLTGPVRAGTVVGAHPSAAYIEVSSPVPRSSSVPPGVGVMSAPDDVPEPQTTDLLAIVRADAVRLPCSVVLAPGQRVPTDLRPGVPVTVGQGAVTWNGGRLVVTRWWTPDRVRDGRATVAGARPDASALRARVDCLTALVGGHHLPDGVGATIEAAARSLVVEDAATAGHLLTSVLGRGPGLTPAADDATAGLLLTLRALAGDDQELTAVVRAADLVSAQASARTTAVSAGLLAHARHGYGARQVVAAITAMTAPSTSPDDLTEAIADLLALGHTSGRDTACGIASAVLTSLSRTPADRGLVQPLRTGSPPTDRHPRRPSTPRASLEIA